MSHTKQTVWLHDANKRRYDTSGNLVKSYSYVETEIVKETRTSWILQNGHKIDKLTGKLRSPKGGLYGLSADVWWTRNDMLDHLYVTENRGRVADMVLACTDATALRKVEEVLRAGD